MTRGAIVTGAASGIGRACAEKLIAEGWKVALADRSERVDEVAAGLGDAAIGLRCDVADERACSGTIAAAEDFLGSVSGLVHAAGIAGRLAPAVELSGDDFREVIEVNLAGAFYMARGAAQRMIAGGNRGSLVLVGSTGGRHADPNDVPYAASKAGVHMMAGCLAIELGKSGIRVNAVAPGPILTDMHLDYLDIRAEEQGTDRERELFAIRESVPLRRHGDPGEVASVAAWLLSDGASYVTGQTIGVDGGAVPVT